MTIEKVIGLFELMFGSIQCSSSNVPCVCSPWHKCTHAFVQL